MRLQLLTAAVGIVAFTHPTIAQTADSSQPSLTTPGVVDPRGYRPSNVPADYVMTPHGWQHPACVIQVHDGDAVFGNSIVRRDGSIEQLQKCLHPRYDAAGRQHVSAQPSAAPVATGWQAMAEGTNTPGYVQLLANWQVPENPTTSPGQVLFYFPGLVPSEGRDSVLQPVLGWNGYVSPKNRWTIASWWYHHTTDQSIYSDARFVFPGEAIQGSMWGESCDAAGVCAKWTVLTCHQLSDCVAVTIYGYPYNFPIMEGGVVEYGSVAGGVETCGQNPANGNVTFSNIRAMSANGYWYGYGQSLPLSLTPYGPSRFDPFGDPGCITGVNVDGYAGVVSIDWLALPPAPVGQCGIMWKDQGLARGQGIYSCSGNFALVMQGDGNLVLYDVANGWSPIWDAGTWRSPAGEFMSMLDDGNLVVFARTPDGNVWDSGTWGNPGSYLGIQDDGNLVVYSGSGQPLWDRYSGRL